jgi:Xaa-Pro dipeptidase
MNMKTAIEKVTDFIKEKEIDGLLFRKRNNFSWLTGGSVNHIVNTTENGVADLVIFEDSKYCITSKMEYARIQDEELDGLGYEYIILEWYEDQDAAIRKLCEGKVMAADIPFDGFNNCSAELASLRFVLNQEEIDRYRWLSKKAAKAVEATCREIEPGWTEYEITAHLAAKVTKEGINPQLILVSTDDRVFKYRHPIPTKKKLEKYAMIVICAEKYGLVSNVTRFVHFGELPAELSENKEKLVQIEVAMIAATRPDVAIKEVIRTGLEKYQEVGHPEDWRLLHQGGPTGYASREFLATPDSSGVVQKNQAFAWNPAIKGVKAEDTILVGEHENEILTFTGEWVYTEVFYAGHKYLRSDILIR